MPAPRTTARLRSRARTRLLARALALAALAPALLGAQSAQGVDRTKAPTLGKPPVLTLPAVRNAVLPNGVQLRVVEQRELPLVELSLVIKGGARLDGDIVGLASFTATMLQQGAGTTSAEDLQAQLAFLGARLIASAGWDATTISLSVPRRTLEPALDLMADVVLRPTFAQAEVARQRDLRLAGLLQQRDQPAALAQAAFAHQFFPAAHPYRRALGGDSISTTRLDSATVRAFYDRTMRPERATLYVAGDIDIATARVALERRFAAWARGTTPLVLPGAPDPSAPATTQVILVDKPGAAQSVITIGAPGVDRRNPDRPALAVMNTLLGGSFSSRLNTVLRETKGYTYGASSRFDWLPLPGPFTAGAAVRTDVTDSSLVEFMRELRAIRDVPVKAEELDRAKAFLTLALPGQLETNAQVVSTLASLAAFGLPLTERREFAEAVQLVTAADLQRVARQYLPVDRLTIVVVGDLAKIRPGIEALRLGTVTVRTPADFLR